MSFLIVYVVCRDPAEAETIARSVVGERLAACANIMAQHESLYWWEGKVQSGREVAMILKTRADLYEKLEAAVKKLHSYEVPCIIALPIEKGYGPFLQWIGDETK